MIALALTLAGVVVAVVELLRTATPQDDYREAMVIAICYAVPFALAGAFLIARRPDLPFGWLLSGAALLAAVGAAFDSVVYLEVSRGGTPGLGTAVVVLGLSGTAVLPIAAQGLINIRFPSGRLSSRKGRVLEIAIIAGIVLGFIAGILSDQKLTVVRTDGTTLTLANPLTDGTMVGRVAGYLSVVIPLVILLGVIAGLGVVKRAWKATGIERYQLRWRAYGVVLALILFPFAVTEVLPLLVDLLDGLVFVVTLAIPVVRYRLWAIDTVIRRSVAYALVTVAVAGLFAVIAAVGTAVASERAGFIAAAAVAAVTFAPVRGYAQRLVDQFFYGQRSDPYRALSDLGRRLADAAAPGEVLPAMVTAVAQSLRLPYVAIERPGDGSVLAATGEPGGGVGEPANKKAADGMVVDGVTVDGQVNAAYAATARAGAERWPLSYQGVTVGVLVAQPRRGERAFDPRDRAVLGDIARQAGAAVHAQALTVDLLDSRQRLVSAREEERRRLRRDLHDGLGPVLTSIGLNIDAARARAERDQGLDGRDDFGRLLGQAKDGTTQALGDLRGIVYGLRPTSLDELGLTGAISAHVRRLGDGAGPRVTLDLGELTDLPAAVEVAAFRIATEAVNNAFRHSGAGHCQVRLRMDAPGRLVVEVCDDGTSAKPWQAGVGLLAMQERAAELGGTLIVGPGDGGGRVRACFPLPDRVSS